MEDKILKALNWRYAVKVFDPGKKLSCEELEAILESGRLSPSSYGIEPWKFLVVENPELRAKLRAVSYDQPKVTDATYIVVLCRRTDARANIARELAERAARASGKDPADLASLQKMVDGDIAGLDDPALDAWIRAQVYIPLGIMLETTALMGIDAGPMEGFEPERVDEILGLRERHLASTVMLALGHRGEDPAAARPKVRRPFSEVVEFL